MATKSALSEGMTDDELAQMLAEHEMRSIGYYESEIASQQADAIARYFRRPYGDERKGRSQVVDSTVATTVDNALAAILKPFVSSDETVVFQPRGEEDEEQASQATEYVNYVLHNDNNGFSILHDWFKDALLCKLGVVKVYWEDKTRSKTERLERLDPMQVEMLMAEEEVVDGPFGPDEHGLYTLDVEREYQDGCIKIVNVPPEEYRISPLARPGETPPYESHIPKKTRSDLVAMGFDPEVVDSLPGNSQPVNEDARAIERRAGEDWSHGNTAPGDRSREVVDFADEYVLVDYDGDGISELRHIIRSNTVILFNEEVEDGPFPKLCPIPMPHTVHGMSLADLVIDEQRIATVLWRQTLDNLYLTNNPRLFVPEGSERDDGSTMDDLSVIDPGAPIRTGNGAEITPFAIPFVADKSYPMLAYVEQQAEARTGIQKQGQGLDPDSLSTANQITATQSAQMEEAQNNRAELIARIFAETGVKQLFRLMVKLLVAHQPRARMIRLRNKWVEMDPRQWNSDMDLSISVGLGIGGKAHQIAVADGILQSMAMGLQDPRVATLFPLEKVFNAFKRKFTASGIKDTSEYIEEPERDEEGNVVEPETPPDPETMKAQAQLQIQQMEAQANQQLKQAELQGKQQEMAAKLQMQQEEAQLKSQLAREEAAAKLQLEQAKAQAEMQMNEQRMAMEMQLAERKMQMQERIAERDASRRDTETDHKMKQNRDGGSLSK